MNPQTILMYIGLFSAVATGFHVIFAGLAGVFPTVAAFQTISDVAGKFGVALANLRGKDGAS